MGLNKRTKKFCLIYIISFYFEHGCHVSKHKKKIIFICINLLMQFCSPGDTSVKKKFHDKSFAKNNFTVTKDYAENYFKKKIILLKFRYHIPPPRGR